MMKRALILRMLKRIAKIAVKVYEFQRNSRCMVAVTAASLKAVVVACMLC